MYSEIYPHDITLAELKALPNVKGVVINGGENNVIDGVEIDVLPEIYEAGVPVMAAGHDKAKCAVKLAPFRNDMEVTDPKKLFGVEVSNGSTDPRRNAMAEAWAAVWGLHRISGSDCHRPPQLGRGGILTMHDVRTDKELVELLKSDDYTLISRVEPK